MNPYATTLLLFALALLQTTVMPFASLGGARPLLPLMAVVSWGLLRGATAGVWWACFAGLMLDVLSPAAMGTYLVPLVLAAGVVALFGGRLFSTNLVLPAAVMSSATIAFDIAQRAMLTLRGGAVAWNARVLGEEIAPAVILNLLWFPLLYFPLRAATRAARARIDWEV